MKSQGKGKKVYVGMSGGVDSSVSAALLKKAGYDVTGVFIKVWQPDFYECTWKEDRIDAMRVAASLDMPFVTLDLEKEYKKDVVDYMIREYEAGRTPNPDVMCNRHIKFGAFFRWAMDQGADYVATGHYAQARKDADGVKLLKGTDDNKDQSYFLWTLNQEQLSHTLFPVGDMPKPEVRKLAKKFKLATADKKDSQGLCFIGKIDMREFLSHYIALKKGRVLNDDGKVIGEHDGAVLYTIGQRHGFLITHKTPTDSPYYVVGKNLSENTITVSHKSPEGELAGAVQKVLIENANWIGGSEPEIGKTYRARIRYRQPLKECVITKITEIGAELEFHEPQNAVAPGQSVVIYDKAFELDTRKDALNADVCLGGGIIAA
jgi:tRNA-uridine 2-sulfurtransferase